MVLLLRVKLLPFSSLLFFPLGAGLCLFLNRFANPFPAFLFYPSFFIQFAFTFLPQLYGRKWGRVFTMVGALVFTRVAWFSDPLQSLAPTGLVGLFLGSILGIWVREKILVLVGRHTTVLPRQSERFYIQWLIRHPIPKERISFLISPAFFLFYFCLVLLLGQFFQSFGMSWKDGLGIPEYLYFPTVSSREYFAQSVNLFVSLSLPILYFLSEERTSTQHFPEKAQGHYIFGLTIGLVINCIVMLVQIFFQPDFFSAGSNLSLAVRRVPGLFLDSGSASWILPTISLFLMTVIRDKIKISKEGFYYFPLVLLFLLVSFLGLRLGKAFWVIWIGGGLVYLVLETTSKIESEKKKLKLRILSFVTLPFLFFLLLFLFSFLPETSSLQRLGELSNSFFKQLFRGEGTKALRAWDPNRYDMTLVALENFLRSPLWGNGWASYLMTLKDPDRIGTILETDFYDSPPNFYLGLLQDIGVYGAFYFLGLLVYTVWNKNSLPTTALLLLPFLFGTQIQHSDGSFVAIFLLFYSRRESESVAKLTSKKWFYPTVLILALGIPLHFLLHDMEKSWASGVGADFRERELGFYQIGAYEWAGFSGSPNHKFQGNSFEWKTQAIKSKAKVRFELIGFIEPTNPLEIQFFNADKLKLEPKEPIEIKNEKEKTILVAKLSPEVSYLRLVSKSWVKFQMRKRDFDSENRLILD